MNAHHETGGDPRGLMGGGGMPLPRAMRPEIGPEGAGPGMFIPGAGADSPHSRRAMLRVGLSAGLALGAAAVLGGCASGRRNSASLPGPKWPSERTARRPTKYEPARPRSMPSTPSAQPPIASNVIPRSAWTNAAPIPSRMDVMLPVRRITVHHDGMPPVSLFSESDVMDRLATIRESHVSGRGWGDIGYHYVIDPQGRVWQGRPLQWQGAHVKDQNPGNLGVLCLGNFELSSPSDAQLASLDRFVAEQMHQYGVPLSQVKTHRELAPNICPGRNLQRYMEFTRRSGSLARA